MKIKPEVILNKEHKLRQLGLLLRSEEGARNPIDSLSVSQRGVTLVRISKIFRQEREASGE